MADTESSLREGPAPGRGRARQSHSAGPALAVNTFGDVERGLNWLQQKAVAIRRDGAIVFSRNRTGAHLAEEQLVQIEEGCFA